MSDTVLVNDAKVMSKGQAETAGFLSEEDIAEWITQSRREDNLE